MTLLFTIREPQALIILATNSMNAKNWMSSGKTHNLENAPHRREILDHLKKQNQRLFLVYVPSAENVADYATRHFGEQSFLQKQVRSDPQTSSFGSEESNRYVVESRRPHRRSGPSTRKETVREKYSTKIETQLVLLS